MANQRGNYKVISNTDRQRIVDVYRERGDYQVLARQLGIARQTALNIVARFQRGAGVDLRARGGATKLRISLDR